MLHTLMQEAQYRARWCRWRSYSESRAESFARVYHESRTVSPTQLVVAVENHARHGHGGTCRFRAMLARRWRGSSAKWECYRCGQRGIAGNCMAPFPVASGGEQGHSSAARQQRAPHKGINRGHRGAGRGGSSECSGCSRSTSAQQQHQASPGSSGSGSGGAASPRTVQVDASSTTPSAPVTAPAMPSAAAPGAMPAAAPGMSSMSDAWKKKSVVCWLVGSSSRRAF